ncbi:MAG: hypothetical protein LBV52_04745 [Spirochaetaceae bacterium]|jgi:diacylglycerol kinase family enzyme|nr:hypothetical protein [Spirochaetaceae bacterium]
MLNIPPRKHLFIVNPVSFQSTKLQEKLLFQIKHYLHLVNVSDFSIYVSQYPRDAICVIRKYMQTVNETEIVRVYAIGGDGICFDCLNGITGISNVEFALMPYGSGIDFVRAFGTENYNLFKSLNLQISAPVIPTDIIKCGSRYALNFCLIGAEAKANMTAVLMREKIKKAFFSFPKLSAPCYCIAGFLSLFDKDINAQYYNISADDEDLSGYYLAVNIANGPYYAAGYSSNCAAVPDDGWLDLVLINRTNPVKIFPYLLKYMHGHLPELSKHLLFRRVKKVSIRSEKPLRVCCDAETFFDTKIDIEIMPQAVKIVAVNKLSYKAPVSDIGILLNNKKGVKCPVF